MSYLKIPVDKFSFDDNWNAKFHSLLNKCQLTEEFPPWVLPTCYGVNQTCGHILQVDLSDVALSTLHLTILEEICDNESGTSLINVAALFIQSTIFGNPIWDLNLQHQTLKKNEDKLYTNHSKVGRYTSKCICPCSYIFQDWHNENHLDLLPRFTYCDTEIFINPTSFVQHLWHNQKDYYHHIIQHMVQSAVDPVVILWS